jgi:ribosomal protein S8
MSMSDPIADLLTRIRNAQMVAKTTVSDAFFQGQGVRSPRS